MMQPMTGEQIKELGIKKGMKIAFKNASRGPLMTGTVAEAPKRRNLIKKGMTVGFYYYFSIIREDGYRIGEDSFYHLEVLN